MGFSLFWSGGQVEDAASDFSYRVADDLEDALEDKDRQIKWVSGMSGLRRRFQDVISLDGLTVAEVRFSSMSSEYRALCVVVPEEESVFYWSVVPKKGSYQQRQLNLMRENSEKINQIVQKRLDQRSP